MKPSLRYVLLSAIAISTLLFTSTVLIRAVDVLDDQLDQTQKELEAAKNDKDKTETRLQELEALKAQYEGSLNSMQHNYSLTRKQLALTETTLAEKETEIAQVEEEISGTETLIEERHNDIRSMIRSMYMSQTPGWFADIFAVQELNEFATNYMYKRAITNSLHDEVLTLTDELATVQEIHTLLEQIKQELADEKEFLETQQRNLQNQINQTQQNISNAQSEMQNLNQALVGINERIEDLTQKQRDILAAKAAAALASTSVGDVEIDQSAISAHPPQDGNVYFSFWTYGYPHRVGMNQYGAFGRAQAGQTAKQILTAYYSGVEIVSWDTPSTIKLTDGRIIPFEEDYLLGISEMPSCWGSPERGGIEALKAQAIAARTYALAYTDDGKNPICTTQACQVYTGASKVDSACGEYWRKAVEETKGVVITYEGSPITAWYASTAGGFTLSAQEVWGGIKPYVTGIADLDESGQPFDGPAHGDSPWYHKAWGDSPWLSVDQVADLANAALMPTSQNDNLALPEKGGFSPEEIVQTLSDNGVTPVTDLTAIEVLGSDTAQVSVVRFYFGDGQIAEVTGERFRFVYNLRSPGTNAIWTTRFDVVTAAEL